MGRREKKDRNQMKKALMTASVASMLDNFNRRNIKLLLEAGYEVTLAANFSAEEDSSPLPRIRAFQAEMEAQGCRVAQIDFSRKLGNVSGQLRSYRQLKKLAKEDFALVHCNSPICAAMTRLAFRKKRKHGTKVIYTAHGFHFFRGAPLKNWLLYFPVEWICAHWTDILNTVNREDYRFAKKWLRAGQVVRLPGVGIDLKKFRPGSADREAVRESLGIREDEKMLLSVGELSRRKNQGNVIRALALLVNRSPEEGRTASGVFDSGSHGIKPALRGSMPGQSLRYVICGQGEMEAEYRAVAGKEGVADRVQFIGYREDISELCQAANLFVFPSLQEGMPMALMEAIAVKIPVICSDIRGNRELVPEKDLRFNPKDSNDIAACVRRALREDQTKAVEICYSRLEEYRSEVVEKKMRMEYRIMDAVSHIQESAGDKDAESADRGSAGI